MNIKTMKPLSLLVLISLLTACSSTNNSTSGSEPRFGSQLLPGGQNKTGAESSSGSGFLGQQNKKSASKVAANNIPTLPPVPTSSGNMRKIVMKAPVKPAYNPAAIAQPRAAVGVTTSTPNLMYNNAAVKPLPVSKPVAVKPATTAVLTKPVPVVKKPQNTTRRLTLNGSANFKSGSSTLTAEGRTKLATLSRTLKDGNTKISRLTIEGHTDSVGDAAMNQVLSLKRANSVADYLAAQGSFARSMMQTVGLGEGKPVASNKTKQGRALNRRVEIAATGTRQISR